MATQEVFAELEQRALPAPGARQLARGRLQVDAVGPQRDGRAAAGRAQQALRSLPRQGMPEQGLAWVRAAMQGPVMRAPFPGL